MKGLLLLILLVSTMRVGHSQTDKNVIRIEFTTFTRGYYKKEVITPQAINMSEEGRTGSKTSVTRKMRKKEWSQLLQALKAIDPAEIPLLKAPTQERASDGARSSSLAISTADGATWSHEFDNENPNAKLQMLMKAITRLEKN